MSEKQKAQDEIPIDQVIEGLRDADDFTKLKAQMIAAIGVAMHSNKPLETRADLVMALVDATVDGVRSATFLHATKTFLNGRAIMPTASMEGCIYVLGNLAVNRAKKSEERLHLIASLFDDEVEKQVII